MQWQRWRELGQWCVVAGVAAALEQGTVARECYGRRCCSVDTASWGTTAVLGVAVRE